MPINYYRWLRKMGIDVPDTPQNDNSLNLLIALIDRFKWTFENLEVPAFIPEFYLLTTGRFSYVPSINAITTGSFSGQPNNYGIGSEWVYTTLGGHSGTEKVEDIVICKNNELLVPDIMKIEMYGDLLNDCDISEKIGIINTRLTNLLGAKDDTQKEAIEDAYEQVKIGKCFVVTDTMNFSENNVELTVNEILPKNNRGDILSLLKTRENILSQFWADFGISLANDSKRAQVNEDELKGYQELARYNLQRAEEVRQEFCNELNRKTDIGAKVELNPILKDIEDEKEADMESEVVEDVQEKPND